MKSLSMKSNFFFFLVAQHSFQECVSRNNRTIVHDNVYLRIHHQCVYNCKWLEGVKVVNNPHQSQGALTKEPGKSNRSVRRDWGRHAQRSRRCHPASVKYACDALTFSCLLLWTCGRLLKQLSALELWGLCRCCNGCLQIGLHAICHLWLSCVPSGFPLKPSCQAHPDSF